MPSFKTRARAVDMLGRQQIANASTAISELFKNAYDAYAKHVEVDYFRSDGLLVIRDDGYGKHESGLPSKARQTRRLRTVLRARPAVRPWAKRASAV